MHETLADVNGLRIGHRALAREVSAAMITQLTPAGRTNKRLHVGSYQTEQTHGCWNPKPIRSQGTLRGSCRSLDLEPECAINLQTVVGPTVVGKGVEGLSGHKRHFHLIWGPTQANTWQHINGALASTWQGAHAILMI